MIELYFVGAYACCHNYSYDKIHFDSRWAKEECIFYVVQMY